MAADVVIRAEGIGKRYFLGGRADQAGGLRHAIEAAVTAPFRRLGGGRGRRAASREEFWALEDVSFEVRRGEVLGLIGRNGAGKSTLLKVLSRITEPTRGRIGIKGRVASLLEVGTGFHPELTGRENVFLNGAILGMTHAEVRRKFDEIVAFAGVERFLDTPVKRYSSGMFVRLAFAVAAHLEPEILVVDEVLAVGDAQFQQKCLGKMREVSGTSGRGNSVSASPFRVFPHAWEREPTASASAFMRPIGNAGSNEPPSASLLFPNSIPLAPDTRPSLKRTVRLFCR
jgi:lipopolysaccharide transport system ATP-binding protein